MMSGLMAKPLPKKETRSFASHASLNDQPAWVQELVLPPPKKGEVLLLARISDETAERASRNDHRCEKCGLEVAHRCTRTYTNLCAGPCGFVGPVFHL